ncbi:hypothetical protein B0H13DRAFT_2304072 [Mycena leptocephala]|nr:hypothetical protein B0H13DRAFT_2304072 [Mycena leptocephala]
MLCWLAWSPFPPTHIGIKLQQALICFYLQHSVEVVGEAALCPLLSRCANQSLDPLQVVFAGTTISTDHGAPILRIWSHKLCTFSHRYPASKLSWRSHGVVGGGNKVQGDPHANLCAGGRYTHLILELGAFLCWYLGSTNAPCLNKRRRRQGVMEIQPSTQPQGGRLGMPLSSETKIWADVDAGAEEWSTWMCSPDLDANLNWRIDLNIIPMVWRILGDFLAIQKKMGERLSNPFPPPTMATPDNTQTPASLKSRLIDEQQKRKREARAAASARYRERHRDAVLEAGRLRAAHRRKNLRGAEYLRERDRAREASARYREGHRKKLALKQRLARKRAYIDKYGIHAYIQRRFDAPIRGRTPDPVPDPSVDASDDENDLSCGDVTDTSGFAISDSINSSPRSG